MPHLRILPWSTACLALVTVCACKRLDEHMEITEKRPVSAYATPPSTVLTSAERFYDVQPQQPESVSQSLASFLDWATPQGWSVAEKATPGGMRLIDLRFGEKQEGECYLSIMEGAGGGLQANVNRWRTQMGQKPYTAEELANLPKKPFFKGDASYVTFDGDYKAVGASEAAPGYRLVGLIQEVNLSSFGSDESAGRGFTIFVKMIGPKDTVAKNETSFEEFYHSIGIKR